MTAGVGTSYDAAGAAWRRGPERVYRQLATAAFDAAPVDLTGQRVLDAGAGTGVAGRAALARGAASAVAVDLAHGMLPRPPAASAVADMTRLPFADGRFDVAVAAFSLSHVPAPDAALRELRRVAPTLLVAGFAPGWTHPAKDAVDEVVAARGLELPAWYRRLKAETEPRVADPAGLAELASAAGYARTRVEVVDVETGLASPSELAGWRLGMAHVAPLLGDLAADERDRLRQAAEAAVAGLPPLVVRLQVLSAA